MQILSHFILSNYYCVGSAPDKIFPKQAEVEVGGSVYFNCISGLPPFSVFSVVSWIFARYQSIQGIAEQEFKSIYIKSVNLTHNGLYTCSGWEKNEHRWNTFIASVFLHVLGKSIIM